MYLRKMVRLAGALVVFMLLVSLSLSGIPPAQASVDSTLEPAVNFTLYGDVTAAGVGLRGTGVGNIVLDGIPAGASVFRAYLYWATLGSANTFTTATLEEIPVDGFLIDTAGDTCWGVPNNFVYRADVTDIVNGNGTYTIAGLPDDLEAGNDSQGASLVVIYEDPALPLRTVTINDGAVALDLDNNVYTDTLLGFAPDIPNSSAHVTYLIGDGQDQFEADSLTFNGISIAESVFSGIDGDLWGTHSFDVTGLVGPAPIQTTLDNSEMLNPASPDCLLWAATIFSTTTGFPLIPDNDLSQHLNVSIMGNVTSAGVGLRGVGSGTIDLNGMPAGARPYRAFLYWATIGNNGAYTTPLLNGAPLAGELIGVSEDTAWGALANFVYRADVTGLVDGNGLYTISGLPNSLDTIGNDSQGASLVVLYGQSGVHRQVMINDGAVTLCGPTTEFTDVLGPFTVDQPDENGHITYLMGDGQARFDTGEVTFEGVSIADNVFTGVDGDHWGTLTFDVSGLLNEPEATTTINRRSDGDCLLWSASVLSVETEVPPVSVYAPISLQNSFPAVP